jgi:transcriptional regulator with XRE-family HTH domain
MDWMEPIDNFLRHLRELTSGKQGDVAERASVSRVYLNRILQGRSMPSLDVAVRLAAAVGYDLGDLMSSTLPERV